ncbi:hypothetical protein JK359_33500 [Streptomyces actinomycinicus]|uniref:Uncharacterized protein n=1 Tax=Streptomyces actinomycinicus TaxID=1695166 RepID=A0A937ENY2_9ACTN|nr:hypothetical protein [Streptomyces actinomycinicus]MBL1086823.1 hypothetical protein [Streptomyces actinomycinicus]
MYLARTLYALACDSCGAVCRLPDEDAENDYELHLPEEQLDPALARYIEAQGWILGSRHHCAACANKRGDLLMERLDLEATHEPLFELTDLPSPADRDQESR